MSALMVGMEVMLKVSSLGFLFPKLTALCCCWGFNLSATELDPEPPAVAPSLEESNWVFCGVLITLDPFYPWRTVICLEWGQWISGCGFSFSVLCAPASTSIQRFIGHCDSVAEELFNIQDEGSHSKGEWACDYEILWPYHIAYPQRLWAW